MVIYMLLIVQLVQLDRMMKMSNNYIVLVLRIMMNLQLHIDDNVDYNMYTKSNEE